MAIDFYFNYTKSLNSWKYVNNFLFLWSFFAYTKVLNPGEIVRRFSHQKKKEKHNSLTHAGCTIRLLFFSLVVHLFFLFNFSTGQRNAAMQRQPKRRIRDASQAIRWRRIYLSCLFCWLSFSKVYCKFLPMRSYFEMSTPTPAVGNSSGSGDASQLHGKKIGHVWKTYLCIYKMLLCYYHGTLGIFIKSETTPVSHISNLVVEFRKKL